jgi:hypothetical protein
VISWEKKADVEGWLRVRQCTTSCGMAAPEKRRTLLLTRGLFPAGIMSRTPGAAFALFLNRSALWLVVLLMMTCPMAAGSDSPAVQARKITSDQLVMDEEFHPASGTYYYDVFLKGVRLGKATISVRQEGDEFSVEVSAKTRRTLNNFYKVRYRGMSLMTPDPITPISAVIEEQTGSKSKTISMEFPEPNRVTSVQLETRDGRPPKRSEKEFESESFLLDPFSTVFLIRNLKWELGTREVFDVFTGRKQYQLELLCQSETVVDIEGELRQAWMIHPRVRSSKNPEKVRMSTFVIYLSKDSRKEILKITGEPDIGTIKARMRKFEDAGE